MNKQFSSPLSEPPVALYIHMPWCIQKCPYCDFNSHSLRNELPETVYIQSLLIDLEHEKQRLGSRVISSIFIGGGTPSLFSAESIALLLSSIEQTVNCSNTMEITLEANPGTVEFARFRDYYEAGINRLSIGIQSFCDDKLKQLGRIHDSQSAIKAVFAAQQAGFNNFNTDLMFGLPGQTTKSAIADLQQAIDLSPSHISHYQLTLEPETPFYYSQPTLPKDDAIWEMQLACHKLLVDHGYQQYEVSAWAKQNAYCQHNQNYWEFGDYLGIGAGAHGKLTNITTQEIIRSWKHKSPRQYIKALDNSTAIEGITPIDTKDRSFEFMMNHLRLKYGFDDSLFNQRTGLSIESLEPALSSCIKSNLMFRTQQKTGCTQQGWRYLDTILEHFLPEITH